MGVFIICFVWMNLWCLNLHCQLVENPLSYPEFRRKDTLCLLKSVAPGTYAGQIKVIELTVSIRYGSLGLKKESCKEDVPFARKMQDISVGNALRDFVFIKT